MTTSINHVANSGNILYVAVYGTLKRDHWNHRLLATSEFQFEAVLDNFKLYRNYPSFPVGRQVDNINCKSLVEVYKIPNDTVLYRLDSLEGEGYMYNRVVVNIDGVDSYIYVGNDKYWGGFSSLDVCEKDKYGVYNWG